jgi:hypothetical protein
MSNFRSELHWQWRLHPEADDTAWDRWTRIDPLEACRMLLHVLKAMKDRNLPIDEYSDLLSQVWWDVDDGLRIVASRRYDDHPDAAKDCLVLIDSLEILSPPTGQDDDAFARWANEFPESESWFPDTLIRALARFSPPIELTDSHRLRRLRYLENRDGNTAEQTSSRHRRNPRSKTSRRSRKALGVSTSGAGLPNSEVEQDKEKPATSSHHDEPALKDEQIISSRRSHESLRVSTDGTRLSTPVVKRDETKSATSSQHNMSTSRDEKVIPSEHDANPDSLDGVVVVAGRGSNHGGESEAHGGSGEAVPLFTTDTMDPGCGIAPPFDSSRILQREMESDKLSDND